MPILVRGGSIITLGNVRQSTAEPLGELMLEIYPDDEAEGFWTLIEDDGESFEYQDGALAETDCRIAPLSQGAVFTLAARRGEYRPAPRTLILRLHLPEAPAGLRLDETPVEDWRWDAELQAAEVRIDDDGQTHRLVPV
jgi:alpha-glucosidase